MIFFTSPSVEMDVGMVPTETRHEERITVTQPCDVQNYRLNQKLLPLEGGNLLLRLRQAPVIEFILATQRCSIPNWELEFSVGNVTEVPRLLARKFLELFSLAQAGKLSDANKATWASILEEVDYAAFSTDRSAHRYMEGRLVRRKPDVTVEWHDGDEQVVPSDAAVSLNLVNEGEDFGAFVKWARGDRIKHIERVTLLLPTETTDDDWLDDLNPH